MSLPTSGFTTQTIRYVVVTEGDFSFSFAAEVKATTIGAGPAEAVASALDSALPSLAADLGNVSGVSGVHVYKNYDGTTSTTDIA